MENVAPFAVYFAVAAPTALLTMLSFRPYKFPNDFCFLTSCKESISTF